MKKYSVLLVDAFVFLALSFILHFFVAMVAKEWAWLVSHVVSLAVIGYLRVEEIQLIHKSQEEYLKVTTELSNAIDDILNGPHI